MDTNRPIPSLELKQSSLEAREHLLRTLDLWFPRCVSPEGGFHQAFARDWTPLPEATRFQVFQSRMAWVGATAAECFPERREEFLGYSRHGLYCLHQIMFNPGTWGAAWEMPLGESDEPLSLEVRTYGIAFELFAWATAARVMADQELVNEARAAYKRLDALYDDQHGGWFEGGPYGGSPTTFEKVFNTHLHVFEALAELRKVDRNTTVDSRLFELAERLSGPMMNSEGRMNALMNQEWSETIGSDWEIGHDLEAAYLLLDSGLGDPAKALRTIDYALEHGFDHERGGFFQLGNANGEIIDDTKVYWTQDEGLNALIAAWNSTGDPKYEGAILRLWAWIRDRQWDQEFGGTLSQLTKEGVLIGNGQKAEPWKACYHDVRAYRNLGTLSP